VRVTKVKDSAIGGDQPITLAIRRRGHPNDRGVQWVSPSEPGDAIGVGRAVVLRVAEVKNAAILADHPVPLPARRCGHPNDWCGQWVSPPEPGQTVGIGRAVGASPKTIDRTIRTRKKIARVGTCEMRCRERPRCGVSIRRDHDEGQRENDADG
jgi:hypothetical protein